MKQENLLKYIQESLKRGIDKDDIINSLTETGLSDQKIAEAFIKISRKNMSHEIEEKQTEEINTKKLNLKQILVAVAFVLLLAAGVFAFVGFSAEASPEAELIKKFKNMQSLDSYGMDYKVDVNTYSSAMGETTEADASYIFYIDADIKNRNFLADFTFLMDFEIPELDKTSINLDGSLTYINDDLYARINDLNISVDEFQDLMQSVEINRFLAQDILIIKGLEKAFNDFSRMLTEKEGLDPITLDDIVKGLEYVSYELLTKDVVEVLNVEPDTLNDESVKKYTAVFDEAKMIDNLINLVKRHKIIENYIPEAKDDFEEFVNILKEQLKYQESPVYTIWANDKYILKMEGELAQTLDEEYFRSMNEQMFGENNEFYFDDFETRITTKIDVVYRDFNQQFDIKAPETFIGIDSILEEISTLFFMQAPNQNFYFEDGFDYQNEDYSQFLEDINSSIVIDEELENPDTSVSSQ